MVAKFPNRKVGLSNGGGQADRHRDSQVYQSLECCIVIQQALRLAYQSIHERLDIMEAETRDAFTLLEVVTDRLAERSKSIRALVLEYSDYQTGTGSQSSSGRGDNSPVLND